MTDYFLGNSQGGFFSNGITTELCGITPPVERGVSGPPVAAGRQSSAPVLPLAVRHGLALLDDAPPAGKRGGRPKVIDELMKTRITTLMATGFSLRQTAGLLRVSRSAITKAVAADPELQEEIEDARQRALMHPLAAIVRESGRNWKAAVWLINHLERAAARDQTPEERTRQKAEESAAFLIQTDMASEMREAARNARQQERQRTEIRGHAADHQARRAKAVQRPPQAPSPPRLVRILDACLMRILDAHS